MGNPIKRVLLRVEHLEDRLTPSQTSELVQPAVFANDPNSSDQWALNQIGLPDAWNVSTGNGHTIVAVIDSGIDLTHPDLRANLWTNPREIAGNGIDDDGNGFVDDIHGADFANNDGDPSDDTGHGTNVAGILGAVGNNGIGIAGVNWTTRIMALKFLRPGAGGLTSDAARAVDYALVNGAKVINLSWGGPDNDPTLAAALQRARDAGAIVVAAAGNGATDIDVNKFFPASYAPMLDNVVAVTATDKAGKPAYFASIGNSTVALGAPGVNLLTTRPGGGYQTLSGTSLATPIVAGAIALTWDTHPTWSYQQVLAKLRSSVDTLSSLRNATITGGRINVAKLLDAPATPPPAAVPPVVPPSTPTPPAVPLPPPPAPNLGSGPKIAASVFRGPTPDRFDRVWVKFDQPINAATLTRANAQVIGPAGPIRISAILPVHGKNNTEFYLMLSQQQVHNGDYRVTFSPTIADAQGRAMNQNGNAINGEPSDGLTTLATLKASQTLAAVGSHRVELAGPKALNELRTNRFDFKVDQAFTIQNLTINLDITHGRTSDLSIRLVGPDGTIANLFNRQPGNNLSEARFSSDGALSKFAGKLVTGTWSLQIFDVITGSRGTLNSLSLNFVPQ